MYVKMRFGLTNVGSTFKRAMDIAFSEKIGYFIVIYLDDITVYSKTDEEHLIELRKVFESAENLGYLSIQRKHCLVSKKVNFLGISYQKKE